MVGLGRGEPLLLVALVLRYVKAEYQSYRMLCYKGAISTSAKLKLKPPEDLHNGCLGPPQFAFIVEAYLIQVVCAGEALATVGARGYEPVLGRRDLAANTPPHMLEER